MRLKRIGKAFHAEHRHLATLVALHTAFVVGKRHTKRGSRRVFLVALLLLTDLELQLLVVLLLLLLELVSGASCSHF